MGVRARRIMAGPGAPGWAGVQAAMVTAADACARAVADLVAAPCSAAAADRVDRAVLVLAQLGEQARCWDSGAAVVEATWDQAFEEGRRAARGERLRSVV
jgi:hypothetical protein